MDPDVQPTDQPSVPTSVQGNDLNQLTTPKRTGISAITFPEIERRNIVNGISLYTCLRPSSNKVSIFLQSRIGSQNEPANLAGVTHYMEHLSCAGTNTPGRESSVKLFEEALDAGGRMNAFTGRGNITLVMSVPPWGAEKAIDLTLDRAFNSTFPDDVVEIQRGIILGELKQYYSDPRARSGQLVNELLFRGTSLAHPVIGYAETVSAFTRDELLNVYQEAFQPELLDVFMIGNYDPKLTQLLVDRLSAVRPTALTAPQLIRPDSFDVQHYSGDQRVLVEERDVPIAYLFLLTDGLPLGDERLYAAEIVDSIMGEGIAGRMDRILREKRGLTYGSGCGNLDLLGAGVYWFNAGVETKNVKPAIQAIKEVLADAKENGFTAEELARAKSSKLGDLAGSFDSTGGLCKGISVAVREAKLTGEDPVFPEEYLRRINAVTLDEVNALAETLFSLDGCMATAVGGTTQQTILEALND